MKFNATQVAYARSVWYLVAQGKTFSEIAIETWPAYANAFSGAAATRRVSEIKKTRNEDEKKKLILHWLKGLLDGVIINATKMGLEDNFVNGGPELSQARCLELAHAKREDGDKWFRGVGGPAFNATLAKFRREDTGTSEPEKLIREVTVTKACKIGKVSLGSQQFWYVEKGTKFSYGQLVEENEVFTVVKSGLDLYVFPSQNVRV